MRAAAKDTLYHLVTFGPGVLLYGMLYGEHNAIPTSSCCPCTCPWCKGGLMLQTSNRLLAMYNVEQSTVGRTVGACLHNRGWLESLLQDDAL